MHAVHSERPINGVWELSVLYPQDPVLCTSLSQLASLKVVGLKEMDFSFLSGLKHILSMQHVLPCKVKEVKADSAKSSLTILFIDWLNFPFTVMNAHF